ncbi:hypothetical protein MATL_G00025210 [Megalops atlanticus]|uniref:Uncharacterized protein n=1 Tax=Megalops atlanticus TaxID=7932 RepID=A0A9D3QHJ9_MEGAT|nr:hypothetical protein MATL_G00025210 [Megalops atlanticus]
MCFETKRGRYVCSPSNGFILINTGTTRNKEQPPSTGRASAFSLSRILPSLIATQFDTGKRLKEQDLLG